MPDKREQEQDSYVKPPVKMLTRDLTEKYVKEIVKEAAKQVLKDKVDAEKLDQAWNKISEQDKEKYLQELEEKIAQKIQNVSTNGQDILREVIDILKIDFDLTKIQNLSQKPSDIVSHTDSEIKARDDGPSRRKGMLRSNWTKGFLGLISIAVLIYLAIPMMSPAQLSLNTTNLDFGSMGEGTPSPLSFAIDNLGKDALTWSVHSNQPWIKLSPSSGTNAGVVQVTVFRGSLQPGDQTGVINVNSKAGDQRVNVSLHVQTPPKPGVYPKSLDFVKTGQTKPDSKALSIYNLGEIPLHWDVSGDVSWIALDRNNGTTNGTIGVGVVGDQDPGKNFQGTITIKSKNAGNLEVPISLEVRRPRQLTDLRNITVVEASNVENATRTVEPNRTATNATVTSMALVEGPNVTASRPTSQSAAVAFMPIANFTTSNPAVLMAALIPKGTNETTSTTQRPASRIA